MVIVLHLKKTHTMQINILFPGACYFLDCFLQDLKIILFLNKNSREKYYSLYVKKKKKKKKKKKQKRKHSLTVSVTRGQNLYSIITESIFYNLYSRILYSIITQKYTCNAKGGSTE